MVRNNKRRAFTIVELVIVIAVIAILAAVMIPTFGGIIKKANISADTQIAASMNTQLSIYKAEGKKIETEADLWAALSSDADFTTQLDPKSAKHGYHYWYDAEKNEIKLLANADVIGNAGDVETQAFAAGGDEIATPFAYAAPRLINGFYLLDKVADDKSTNDIAKFFKVIAEMSKADADYIAAIANLKALKGDNAGLATAILGRMEATAILTDKGAYINVNEGSNVKVQYIYIPENQTEGEYYLNHTVINVGSADVDNLLDVTNTANTTIEIPEGVKVAEGSLNGFANATIKVNANDVASLSAIFSADSVATDATIVLNNGATYAINGTVVTEKATGNEVATLAYKNPATSLDVSATGNIVLKSETNYIALDKIKNTAEKINITLSASPKNSNGEPAYATVSWFSETAGVTIDVDGTVTFDAAFNANMVTFRAEVDSTTVLDDGTVQKSVVKKTFTANIVRVKTATVNFSSGANSGSVVITDGGDYNDANFLVSYADASTTAKFETPTLFKYADVKTGNLINFTNDELADLGCNDPQTAMTTIGDKYFAVADDYTLSLDNAKITPLNGSKDVQTVTVKISDNAGVALTATVNVTVNDNQNAPFDVAIPSYKNGYIYKVGNGNTLPLGELLAKKANVQDIGEYSVYVYNTEADYEGYFYAEDLVATFTNPSETTALNFENLTGNHWVVLGTTAKTDAEDETVCIVPVEIVAGKNFTDADALTNLTQSNGNFAYATYAYYNIVLHDDFVINSNTDGKHDLALNDTTLYGNYFTIEAKTYIDEKQGDQESSLTSSTKKELYRDGYSFMTMSGTSYLNQVIIDGPVYSDFPPTGSKDTTGIFCFGVNCSDTSTITDSYVFGFLTPVRVNSGTLNMVNSVVESGTWANMWIASATKITLDNSKTIQNYDGYEATYGDKGDKVIALGIYLDDSMGAETEDKQKSITIEFKGDTEQINWFGENADDKFGGYAAKAKGIVFEKKKDGTHVFGKFMHEYDGVKFVNAAIAWQANDILGLTSKNFVPPAITFVSTYWTANGEKTGVTYVPQNHEVINSFLGYTYEHYVTLVHSSVHEPEGTCESCELLNANMEQDYGAKWFRGTRINLPQ